VTLDHGREWFEAAWGAVPTARGRDCAAILGALAEGSMRAVVLLGADPVGDFPDRELARSALSRAPLVVAVDTLRSASLSYAHVVLPAVMAHERTGTTTNVEGRLTRLSQKVVAPGQCRADWVIAAELALRMDADLGIESVAELWDEIERLAPSHAGITRAALDSPGNRDGVVAPLSATAVRVGRRSSPEPIDPMATPGIESADRQGAPPLAGLVEPVGSPAPDERGHGIFQGQPPSRRPPLLGPPTTATAPPAPPVPPLDNYSLRLVADRRLYDDGVALRASASTAGLAETAVARANPYDLDRLGVRTGDAVRVRSARGALVLPALADPEVTKGVVVVPVNVRGPSGTVSDTEDGTVIGTEGRTAHDIADAAQGTAGDIEDAIADASHGRTADDVADAPQGRSADDGASAPQGGTAADLIDASAAVADVRLETV
jgi:NADH-quinone oxidoreductase subunit G